MEGVGVPGTNKSEIDTSAPFRSVKEAVVLFGERVLVGELYTTKIKEAKAKPLIDCDPVSELEETKQNLKEAREESIQMARCLSSLQQELEYTKFELQQLKIRAHDRYEWHLQINEEFKFVECSTKKLIKETTGHDDHGVEDNKKKYVRFANLPVTRVEARPCDSVVMRRHAYLKNKMKKTLIIPFIGAFAKKKAKTEFAMA